MAIISVNEDPTKATYSPSAAVRGWNVLFDGADEAAAMVALAVQHAAIPRVNTSHPSDPWQRSGEPRATWKSGILVEVEVSYECPRGAGGAANAGENPLNQPPEISWDWITTTEPADVDFDGKGILNSAYDPIEPQLQVEFYDPVCTIVRNEPMHDKDVALQYRYAVNSDVFWGVRPGQALMLPITARRIVQGDLVFWQKTYRIAFRDRNIGDVWNTWEKLWHRRVADVGYNALISDALASKQPVRDANGNPVTRPVPLNDDGTKADGDKIVNWLHFRFVRPVPFAPLGLPQG